jgi:hypothetical protein
MIDAVEHQHMPGGQPGAEALEYDAAVELGQMIKMMADRIHRGSPSFAPQGRRLDTTSARPKLTLVKVIGRPPKNPTIQAICAIVEA